jgi:polar amino acid transport system substrate-binding protein
MRAWLAALLLAAAPLAAAGPTAASAATPPVAPEPTLRVGFVPSAPPFVVRDPHGNLTGFSVALFDAIAARLKRSAIFTEAPLPELIEQLADGKLDVLPGPIPATPDRAAEMLFTEGYVWSEDQFATREGTPLTALSGLHGMRLAVQAGSEYAEWAARNTDRLGFAILSEATVPKVFDAVRLGTADASLTDSVALRGALVFAPKDGAQLAPALSLPETRTHMAMAVGVDEVDLRDEIEDALRCLKQDGTVAKLSSIWLGATPGPEDLENLLTPGYGVPGLSGYDPKPRKVHCGQ